MLKHNNTKISNQSVLSRLIFISRTPYNFQYNEINMAIKILIVAL